MRGEPAAAAVGALPLHTTTLAVDESMLAAAPKMASATGEHSAPSLSTASTWLHGSARGERLHHLRVSLHNEGQSAACTAERHLSECGLLCPLLPAPLLCSALPPSRSATQVS